MSTDDLADILATDDLADELADDHGGLFRLVPDEPARIEAERRAVALARRRRRVETRRAKSDAALRACLPPRPEPGVSYHVMSSGDVDAIEQAAAQHPGEDGEVTLVWYASDEDFASLPGRDPRLWRPHQSALAEVAFTSGARLVVFDRAAYEAWRAEHGRADSEQLRAEWAARQPSTT